MLLSTRLGDNPWPLDPRRSVAYMLEMAARQFRDPVALIVQVETANGLFHRKRESNQRFGEYWREA